jgi:hypothetical protein
MLKILFLLLFVLLVCFGNRSFASGSTNPLLPSSTIIAEEISFTPDKKPAVTIKYYECRGKKPIGKLKAIVLPFFNEEMAKIEMAKIEKGTRFRIETEFGLYFTCPVTCYTLVPEL